MQRCTYLCGVMLFFTYLLTGMQPDALAPSPRKQKVLILSCKGGNGHKTAAAIVKEILEPSYTTTTVYPIETTLHALDPVARLTGDRIDGEEIYDMLLNNGYTRFIDIFTKKPTQLIMSANFNRMQRRFKKLFLAEKPDVIVSVAPWFNGAAAAAAAEQHIPYICTALDFNLKMWLHDLARMQHPAFALTIAEKTPLIENQITRYGVNPAQIHAVGPLANKSFYNIKDGTIVRNILHTAWNIPIDKPLVLVMMGGAGSKHQLKRITTTLIKANLPAHLAICVGRDPATGKKLRKLPTNGSQTTFTVIDFTKNVHLLMQAADVMIGRGGGVTCLELLVTKLPVIFDCSIPCMSWERTNIEHFIARGYGSAFTSFDQLPELVSKHLGKRSAAPTPENSFPQKLLALIDQLKQQASVI